MGRFHPEKYPWIEQKVEIKGFRLLIIRVKEDLQVSAERSSDLFRLIVTRTHGLVGFSVIINFNQRDFITAGNRVYLSTALKWIIRHRGQFARACNIRSKDIYHACEDEDEALREFAAWINKQRPPFPPT